MAEEIKQNEVNDEEKKESAGCLGIGFSFIIPLVGFILYFSKKSDKFDASGYLYAAIAGAVLNVIFKIAASAA